MKITLRTDSIEVEGYVNAVGRDSRMLMDENGYSFREQIDPGTFAKALRAKADAQQEISLLLDHNQGRVLGGTGSNLMLEEDSIGLMARATITDPEVIEKARNHQLRGWSFGFRRLDSREEYTSTCRRIIVTEMDLVEVTLVDDQEIPAYAGTSVHTRTDGTEEHIQTRAMDGNVYTYREQDEIVPPAPPVDNGKYYNIIKELKERSR